MKSPAARARSATPAAPAPSAVAPTGRMHAGRAADLPAAASDPAERARGASAGGLAELAQTLSPLAAHDLVTRGLPILAVLQLLASFQTIERPVLLETLGISERTLQRAASSDRALDSNASDRALRLAVVTSRATEVLGSRDRAEQWLSTPAVGLDQRRPIALLQSSEGTELVKTLLGRIDHGVYA